ncbi:unnamed protein product [Paramecium sonneborni]|uniref:Uncharacterized protein n=1 Tax=Paramecium sonneborni TaxID=65129 RepID=A0A8S1MP73_9CILI|nr:unnamed protein product [Paramecium sonneborni]
MIVKQSAFQINEIKWFLQTTRMTDQVLINLFDQDMIGTESLVLAIATPYDQLPTVIDIIDNQTEMVHTMARSLAKKLSLQVFLNYNHSSELTLEIFQQLREKLIESIIQQ